MKYIYLIVLTIFTAIRANACDATISPSDTICYEAGLNYQVIFTGSGGTAPYTFVYSVNGGPAQTVTSAGTSDSAVLDLPMPGLGNVNYTLLSVTDATGCTATINQSSDFLFVINPVGSVSGTTTVYQNSTPFPEFVLTGSGGIPPYTFKYTINGGPQQTITSPPGTSSVHIPISTATVGTYTLELIHVYSSFLCQSLPTTGINGSTATITVIPNPMTVSGTNQTVCAGAASANFSFSASGSTGPYTYSYTAGGVPQTITGGSPITIPASTTTAGTTTYQLTGITDSYGNYQAVSASSSVIVLPTPTGTLLANGPCTKYTLNLSASGGTGPFTYQYTVNGVTNTVVGGSSLTVNGPNVSSPTTFVISGVSVTNSAGCTGPLSGGGSLYIVPNENRTMSVSATSVCVNGPMPSVSFSCYSCAAYSYGYTINSGFPQSVPGGGPASVQVPTTTPGTYVYTMLSSGQMCDLSMPQSVTVVVKPLPTATVTGAATVCKNATQPTITFTGANGTAPYTFTYKLNGGANQTISSGTASTATINVPTSTTGTFTYSLVSVSSAAGCSQSQTGSAAIVVSPLPTASISGSTMVCQNDAAPSVTFTGSNGTAPYTFSYNINGGATQTITSTGSSIALNVPTGVSGLFTYNLLSVSETNGCSQNQTSAVTIVVNPSATASISGGATVCQNAASQVITFTGANGTAPYIFTYKLNGGANQTISSGSGSTATISVPTTVTGTFTYSLVSVASSSGCGQNQTGSASVVVNPRSTASISGGATVCQNDAQPGVTFTGSGGTAPYTFSYNINGGATQTISTSSGSSVVLNVPTTTTGTFTYNLLSVSNAGGCSQNQTGSAVIVVNSMPTASISGGATVCQNSTPSVVTFTGSGGTTPYTFTYSLNGGANQTISSGTGSTATISVPATVAGTFTYNLISVASPSGCTQSQTGLASVVVNPVSTASISGTATVCQNAVQPAVTFTGSGGTAPYTFSYNINGGATQTISTSSGSSVVLNAPTATAGTATYSLLSVSNANGCSQNQTGSATIVVNGMPTASISGGATVCQNTPAQVITFTGANGTAPYTFTYNLNGGSNQTISSGTGSTATISIPTSTSGTSTYNLVSVASSSGCTQSQTASASVVVNPVSTASISGGATVCQNAAQPAITFTGSGGTTPYTFSYTINGGGTQTISSGTGSSVVLNAPTATAGTVTYSLLSVSNANGCSQNQTGSAIIAVNSMPTASISGTATVCQNAAQPVVTFTGSNGSLPYTFTYNINGGTTQTISSGTGSNAAVTIPTTTVGTSTYNLLSVSSVNGCSQNQTGSATVIINPTPIVSGASSVCQGASIQLSVTGTSTGASWSSSHPSIATVSASGEVTGVSAGTVQITYTEASGCSTSQTIQVLGLPTASIGSNATICTGDNATFTLSGTPGSTVDYTDGATTSSITIPASGTISISSPALYNTTNYTLLHVQSASCSQSLTGAITITVNPIPVIDPVSDINLCARGLVQIPAFTGTNGISFAWTNTNTAIGLASSGTGTIPDFTAVNNQSGSQTAIIEVTPVINNCAGTPVSFSITVNNLPVAHAGSDQSACLNDGIVHQIGAASSAGNTYSWSPGTNLNNTTISNPVITADSAGTISYVLTVTNNLGCENTDTVAFTGVEVSDVSLSSSSSFSCEDGMVSIHLTTTEQVSIQWFVDGTLSASSNGTDLNTYFGTSGTHSVDVLVTNSFGCSKMESLNGGIQVYPDVTADFTTGLNSNTIDEFTDQIELVNLSENASVYNWYVNGNWASAATNPTLALEEGLGNVEILLIASNEYGCSDTATLVIEPLSDGVVYVPNTFTPNGDGTNELFIPVISDDFSLDHYLFEIYNRWGERIFTTTDRNAGWNGSYLGQLCKTDMYVWKLSLKSKRTGFAESMEGHVNLLR